MAYTATYQTADISSIVIDAMGTFGAEFVPLMGLVALGLVLTVVFSQFSRLANAIGM